MTLAQPGIPPALWALAAQFTSLGFVLIVFRTVSWLYPSIENDTYPWIFVIFQSAGCFLMTAFLRIDPWWKYLNAIFPILVMSLLSVQISPSFYLIAFLICGLIFSNTLIGRVPYFPMGRGTWVSIASVIDQHRPLKVIDIGSGLGGLSLWLQVNRPNLQIFGVEIAPLPWLISFIRAFFNGGKSKFMLGSYHKQNFADYDIVIAYLSPAAMPGVWKKASKELKPGSLLISHEFAVPNVVPCEVLSSVSSKTSTYIYRF